MCDQVCAKQGTVADEGAVGPAGVVEHGKRRVQTQAAVSIAAVGCP